MKVITSKLFSGSMLGGKMILDTFFDVLGTLKEYHCTSLSIEEIEPIRGEPYMLLSSHDENEKKNETEIPELNEYGYRVCLKYINKGFYFIELRPLNPNCCYHQFDLNTTIEKNGSDHYNGLVPNEVKILKNHILIKLKKGFKFI